MRFARTIVGMLLLTVALPALFTGGALGLAGRHRDAGGAFHAATETVAATGHAVVVPDLAALLRREVPVTRLGRNRLRLTAQTPHGPAFLGLAPADEVNRYLAGVPYAALDRIVLTRGPLPVRVRQVPAARPPSAPAAERPAVPAEQPFWVRRGLGALDWTTGDLRGRRLSLVVMLPDAQPAGTVDFRVEFRPGWLDPVTWALLAGGAVVLLLAVGVGVRPVRPREVVFVVEPEQVPVLSARLGVMSLDALGRSASTQPIAASADSTTPASSAPPAGPADPAEQVGSSCRPTPPADVAGQPISNPVTETVRRTADSPSIELRLAWPALRPHQAARSASRPVGPARPDNPVPEREVASVQRRNDFRSMPRHLREHA